MAFYRLDELPAVRRLDTDRDDLFAAEIEGHVASSDFENLCGLLEGSYAIHDRIDLLLRFVDHDGVDWHDVADASIKEAREHAAAHIGRCAAIGPSRAVSAFSGIFCPAAKVELRRFKPEDEAGAWAWLGATEKPEQV